MSRRLSLLLALLRIAAGVSLIGPGLHNVGWFAHPTLEHQLAGWSSHIDNPLVLKYLHFVTPHASVLARLVAAGELGLGALLVLGFLTPLAASLAFFMVLNFHFASGMMLSHSYVTGQNGLVYLLIFPVLVAGRAGILLGIDGLLGRRSAPAPR